MKQFYLLLLLLGCIVSVQAQSKRKVATWNFLVLTEAFLHQMDSLAYQTKPANLDSIKTYSAIAQRLRKQQQFLPQLVKQSKSIRFCHLFLPKPDVQFMLMKTALKDLEETTRIQQHFLQVLPYGAVLHIATDTLPDSLSILQPTQLPDSLGKRSWKAPFDPWVNDVYRYNIQPGIQHANDLSLLIEYRRFRNSYLSFKASFPKRWKKQFYKLKKEKERSESMKQSDSTDKGIPRKLLPGN